MEEPCKSSETDNGMVQSLVLDRGMLLAEIVRRMHLNLYLFFCFYLHKILIYCIRKLLRGMKKMF